MSTAGLTIYEYNEEEIHYKVEALYGAIMDEYFPNLEQVINIKTGPNWAISIDFYPSFSEAEKI